MKHEDHNMDDLFKRAFEEHSVPPPNALWGKIESELPSLETDQIFQKAFSNYEVEPSPAVWQNIKHRLPINVILRRHLTWLSRVAAVVLVGMFVIYALENWETSSQNTDSTVQSSTKASTKEAAQASNESMMSNTATAQNEIANSKKNKKEAMVKRTTWPVIEFNHVTVEEANIAQSSKEEKATNTYLARPKQGEATKSTVLETIIPTNVPQAYDVKSSAKRNNAVNDKPLADSQKEGQLKGLETTTPMAVLEGKQEGNAVKQLWVNSLEPFTTSPLTMALSGQGNAPRLMEIAKNSIGIEKGNQSEQEQAMNFEGFYFSLNAQGHNSHIFNQTLETQVSTMGGNSITRPLDFGYAYGAALGYKINEKLSIEVGANHSTQGQVYKEVGNSTYTTEIDLTYIQVPVLAKYRFKAISGNNPSSFSVVAGTQFNFLKGNPSVETINSDGVVITPAIDETLLIKNELSGVIGADWDLFLNPSVSLSLGLRAIVGTDSKFQTTNALLGGKVGMNYRFVRN